MPGSTEPAPESEEGASAQESTVHEGHEVEMLAEDVVPVAGFARDKFYCWDCGVGWSA